MGHNDIVVPEPARLLQDFLDRRTWVQYVQFRWIDFSGVLRVRVVTKEYAVELATQGTFLKSSPIAFRCIVDNARVPGVDFTTSNVYQPDWKSICSARGRKGHAAKYAAVMCDVSETSLGMQALRQKCPRQGLANVLRAGADSLGLAFLVGFEIELIIMHLSPVSGVFEPYSSGFGRYSSHGLRHPAFRLVEKCVEELRASGVCIQGFHTEGFRGQYEMSLGPLPPIEAADQLVFVNDKIKSIVSEHGYYATMSPKPVADWHANGQHTHVSVSPSGCEGHFLAGILRCLRGICAFTMPYEVSYQRVTPNEGGMGVSWGSENRAVPVRRVAAGHWEIRCVDATSNVYLSLAIILGAGIVGAQRKEALRWPDASTVSLCAEAPEPLPNSLADALESVNEDFAAITAVVGDDVIPRYLQHKRHEMTVLKAMEPEYVRGLLIETF
ncbi:glutamine synthetase/guanido kinase [Aspergillus campestris IBT 28561]|uniref:Glutamine synthetase n=1 Tax=Aspergillus campestris (strain IBT 28561) TaxID=1392248 RepID=A0A2I1D2L8_ASPC2|nr:glutamine synthetase/guanido kinase [Aspergillus campestris IBT 28561]PKY04104.1 glutamine synthetase/guanido kinase [Aspergillus campestris IBT 28561]